MSNNVPLRKDGEPDQRYKGASSGDDSSSEQSTATGRSQPEEIYKPSEHDGLRKDGQPDQRLSSEHGFGSRDKDELKEIAASGGRASGGSQQEEDVEYTE